MINIRSDKVIQRYVKALHSLSLEQNKDIKIKNDLSLIGALIEKNKEFKKQVTYQFETTTIIVNFVWTYS